MEIGITQRNWAAGEVSPKLRARSELPSYKSGSERLINFISETAGPIRFRSGWQYAQNTRRHRKGWLLPFQFNDSDAYELEFTEGYIRFYRDSGIVTSTVATISGVTPGAPITITAIAHGFSNGDEVIINGVKGTTQLNNRSFVVTNSDGVNTFQLLDSHGDALNGSAYSAYVSGGTATKIYEIQSPYYIADVPALKIAQNADTVYITHPSYEPRKLTRLAVNSWTIGIFSRTADPFLSKKTISGITQALPAKVTASGHGYSTGDVVIIEGVVGMTEINGTNAVQHGIGPYYTITKVDNDNFTLDGVDSSTFNAWSSGGYASNKKLLPGACAFYQGRFFYGYSDSFPESFWGSKPLDSSGNPQYDDLTLGANPTDAFKFTLSPVTNKVDKIESLVPSLNFLAICTFEGISKANGGSDGSVITPSNIDVVPVVTTGVLQQITPFLLGIVMMYVHRSALVLYSLEFDIFYNAYNALDKTLVNDQWTESGLIQMAYSVSRPTGFYFLRNDGVLIWLSYMVKENVNAASRLIIEGTNAKILSCGVMPRRDQYDKLWAITERTIGGKISRFVEFQNDELIVPELDDYWTGDANSVLDTRTWRNAMFEAQKGSIHVDAALTYDGSDYGVSANAALTPTAVTGNAVIFNASAPVFDSSMVGRELWKQAQNGVGTGRATIIAFINSTQVVCKITSAFDNINAMPAGKWYLTTDTVTGAWHLEGESVRIITDGGEHPEQTVSNGSVSLEFQASVVHLGKGYNGVWRSMHLDSGTPQVPADARKMNVNRIGVRFLNTLGCRFGTDLYNMRDFQFRSAGDLMDRPTPFFSGHLVEAVQDDTAFEKHFYLQQIRPLPCTIEEVTLFTEFDDK